MWETPVNIFEIHEPIIEEINKQTEETIFKAIHRVGVDVNKEELIKAMQYDRGQYEKGYKDGYAKAIDEFINQMEAEVESSAKFIREYDDSIAQKAYYKGLCHSLYIAEQMKGGV